MIKAIIIDDEALAIANLQAVISNYNPSIDVVATSTSIIEGAKLWAKHQPEVVFLDVEMEGGSGFDVWDLSANHATLVVMVTAHKQYAIEAIKRGAFDYLLKPVDIDDMVNIEKKINDHLTKKEASPGGQRRLKLPVRDGFKLIDPETILYLRAEKSYTEFHFADGSHLLVSKNLKSFEEELLPLSILRCHKSFIINLKAVVEYNRTDGGFLILSNQVQIPVSKEKKGYILQKIGELI